MKLDGFIPGNNSICCSIDGCNKASIGHIWMPLEILIPKINDVGIFRPITLCQDHFNWLEEVLEDVESSFELRQIIKEGGDINVPNSE